MTKRMSTHTALPSALSRRFLFVRSLLHFNDSLRMAACLLRALKTEILPFVSLPGVSLATDRVQLRHIFVLTAA